MGFQLLPIMAAQLTLVVIDWVAGLDSNTGPWAGDIALGLSVLVS